ncbi:MAG: hypothetical protein CVU38_19510 [Chloroflexi bacterium HGW-Chloroflexi-1]|nr:MAG: hypothetical protein CVU38_19510 [Chloroflexi bacterium HGW-Chloroflexi-1]
MCIVRFGLVLLLVLSSSFFMSGSAKALCWGSGCFTLNPATTGCSANAYTAAQSNNYLWQIESVYLYVQLRYSTSCNANWSRSYTWDGWSGVRYIRADMAGVSGFTYDLGTFNGYSSVYTNMVDGSVYQCAKGAMRSNTSNWYYGANACA